MKTFLKTVLLLVPVNVLAQTAIYRSVQPGNTSAIAVGTGNNLRVSNDTCYFANELSDTVGVGCALQYDDDNDGDIDANDSILFFKKRVSSTVFLGQDAAGAAPTATAAADQDWSIFHAYTSLANLDTGTENTGIDADKRAFDAHTDGKNIDTANQTWQVACYRGTDNTAVALTTTWNMSATDTLRIFTPVLTTEVGLPQRHSGSWSTAGYILTSASASATLDIGVGFARQDITIDGLQIENTAGDGIEAIAATSTINLRVQNCILRGSDSVSTNASHAGINIGSTATLIKVLNTITYNWKSTNAGLAAGSGFFFTTTAGEVYVYNSNAIDNERGFSENGVDTLIYKNCLAFSNADDDFEGGAQAGSEFNASGDATAPGTDSRASQTFTFVDFANDNFLLANTDTGAKGFGKDLSADAIQPVTTDIQSASRTVPTCIGADENDAATAARNRVIIIGDLGKLGLALFLAGLLLRKGK